MMSDFLTSDSNESVEFLTVAEAAALLRLSPRTLNQWRLQPGYGPPFVRVGAAIRYQRNQLSAWIELRTVSVEAPEKNPTMVA